MTSPLDDVFDEVTYEVVQTFGTTVKFVATTVTFDPATDTQSEASRTHTTKVTPPERYKKSLIDGTNIRVRDANFILPAKDLAFTPERDMKVIIGSNTFTVVDFEELYSGEKIAAYKIQVR